MMDQAWRRLSAVDSRRQSFGREARVDRAADGVSDKQARPGVENDSNVNEGAQYSHIG